MARINVEDSLYKDIRFIDLVSKLGSLNAAIGAVVRAWSLAQEWYLCSESDRLIPERQWKKQKIDNEIIDVGLAERREKGIYVFGADKQFEWLLQKQVAGKRSGDVRKKTNKNKRKKLTPVNGSERMLTHVNVREPLTLTPSLTLTHTHSNTHADIATEVAASDKKQMHKILELWNEITQAPIRKCRDCTPKRLKACKALWAKHPDETYWRDLIKKVNANDYCKNKAPDSKGWVANPDWFLRDGKSTEIEEGLLDNRRPPNGSKNAYRNETPSDYSKIFREEETA